jgi:type VI secretion system protein ImpH
LANLAASYWDERTPIKNQLLESAYNFEFYQAVKLLEMFFLNEKIELEAGKNKFTEEAKEKLVKDYFNSELYQYFGGPVTYKSNVNPSFPASELERIEQPEKPGAPYEMFINFMGLTGLSGPMPAVYAQMIIDNEKINPNNTVFRDFLDLFNNHLINLMYKVRRKCRFGFDLRMPEETDIAHYLFSLLGLETEGLKNRLSIKDRELLYYTGLLANQNRSIAGLEFVLGDYLDVKVECRPLQGQWQRISGYQITNIGLNGQNQILGDSVVLGESIWDQGSKFDINIGPLNQKQYENFLPLANSISYRPLYELTRQYVGTDTDFEAILIVDTTELQGIKLNDPVRSYLGWTSWLPMRNKNIFDYDELFFVEAKEKIQMDLENGKRLKLGWTVWVPDEKGKIRYIEIRLHSSTIENYI